MFRKYSNNRKKKIKIKIMKEKKFAVAKQSAQGLCMILRYRCSKKRMALCCTGVDSVQSAKLNRSTTSSNKVQRGNMLTYKQHSLIGFVIPQTSSIRLAGYILIFGFRTTQKHHMSCSVLVMAIYVCRMIIDHVSITHT